MAGRQGPPPRRVVAWGTSVLASALVAGLAKRSDLELVQVEATLPAALAALASGAADVVLCDLDAVPAACVLRLLAAHPRVEVVIVDLHADHGLVLSGRRPRMRTIDDLVAVLRAGTVEGAGAAAETVARTR